MQLVNTLIVLFWTLIYGDMNAPNAASLTPTTKYLPARGPYEGRFPGLKLYVADMPIKDGYVLRLRSGFVTEVRSVKVTLNHQLLGYLPPCANDWTEEVTYDIPKDFLVAGKNEIQFVSSEASRWTLRDILLEYSEHQDDEDIYTLAESAKVTLESLGTPMFSKIRLNTYLKKMAMLPLEEPEYEKYSRPFKLWLKQLDCHFY